MYIYIVYTYVGDPPLSPMYVYTYVYYTYMYVYIMYICSFMFLDVRTRKNLTYCGGTYVRTYEHLNPPS